MNAAVIKQHVIDPEICIRCDTCEQTCPTGAVTHDANNYVVDAEKCNFCMDCISPCPTGSINNWRMVATPYSLEEQFSWSDLPPQPELGGGAGASEAIDAQIAALIAEAHGGAGGKSTAPKSAASPSVNLYNRQTPALATVTGIIRLTAAEAENDVRHIILEFGDTSFPVLEGQSVGIAPPGKDARGEPHKMRLYSLSSSRDGEKPRANNIALTVKRDRQGLCSNYLCDLKKGARVEISGPYGATFLMPNDPAANIIMICTGTGSAPFRGFTEWRRRAMPQAPGKLMLFFGARRPEELPYFGPLQKVPEKLLAKHFAYSRVPGAPKTYVQDLMRLQSGGLAALLRSDKTHVFICGLRGMEQGVDAAFADMCRGAEMDWNSLRGTMRDEGRYHVETY